MFLIFNIEFYKYNIINRLSWIIYSLDFKILEFNSKFRGKSLKKYLIKFLDHIKISKVIIGYNIYLLLQFLNKFRNKELFLNDNLLRDTILKNKYIIDLQSLSIRLFSIYNNKIRWPKLSEIYNLLFKSSLITGVLITAKCFFKLILNQTRYIKKIQLSEQQPTSTKNFLLAKKYTSNNINIKKYYYHIHNHSSYSILNSSIDIDSLVRKIVKYKMQAIGLTDYGNMMGVVQFINTIENYNKIFNLNIKPIIGCEFYIYNKDQEKEDHNKEKDKYHHQVLIAKNLKGYYNLVKLCSLSYIEGYSVGRPTININLIKQYKANLIALSSDSRSEISFFIKNKYLEAAENKIKWWFKEFGKDFYIEIFRHGLEVENEINKILLKFSNIYNIPYIIQNNNFYLNKKEAEVQDILLCLKYGEKPGMRIGLTSQEHYVKSKSLMYDLFSNFPEGFKNLNELFTKIEGFKIAESRNFPKYYFHNLKYHYNNTLKENIEYFENKYLKELTLKKVKAKLKVVTTKIKTRLDFELRIIERINYPGYFLIVRDIIKKARKIGILVGPGRGSVVGSLVAYCLDITRVHPVKYNLLFERFLNKSRLILPDIDIDFDDKGREKIIKWLINKYSGIKVSQIITYGTLGAKSAFRDAARVLNYPFQEINTLSKLMPNFSLEFLFRKKNKDLISLLNNREYNNLLLIKKEIKKNKCLKKIFDLAMKIEGNIRTFGIHACGILITQYDIREYLPIICSKYSNCLVTQYDNKIIEKIGLLKIDFLGLKTLSIIKDALKIINKKKYNIYDINNIPLTDEKTLSLFKSGKTTAVFQYESSGIQKNLKKLKPRNFEDLIIMTALYRPGPLKNLYNYIDRKNGIQPVIYELAELEEYLKETKGIIIYQEQVMLITQKVSNFNKAEADILRQAISKKKKDLLDSMKDRFIEGGIKKGHFKQILSNIWDAWENFASYAFNKSHSASYTFLSFQTGYLKSHFPVEYMSSVLSHNMQNIKEISLLIKECKRMGFKILIPNINLSNYKFGVSKKKSIRYGLGAIKGIGKTSIKNILKYRKKRKKFTSIFNLVKSVNLRLVNKKVLENLVLSGALDVFKEIHRAQYFVKDKKNHSNMIEKIIKFGIKYQKLKKHRKSTLFNNICDIDILEPKFKKCRKWNHLEKLNNEKEVLGFYLFSHPIEKYKKKIKKITDLNIKKLKQLNININIKKLKPSETKFTICGMVSHIEIKKSRNNRKYLLFTIEDQSDFVNFLLIGKKYSFYKKKIKLNKVLIIDLIIKKNYLQKYFYKIISIQNIN
ncbi:DNA polymerase III alpha subunit [Candidatus Karelsulcia muelleri]|uniref:DNA polymerase III subunit alpha n=1 Tax=Candidatus Karelsulcia muelleri TaxID=336810 RepID=UPI001FF63801|nr:DNA polymerase III subunit alpha [Candidatus Karelsulcia muelleri]UOQ27684.1 DNA polymerase III alpha subunit [Candidatus Karelsulcia muelleri]